MSSHPFNILGLLPALGYNEEDILSAKRRTSLFIKKTKKAPFTLVDVNNAADTLLDALVADGFKFRFTELGPFQSTWNPLSEDGCWNKRRPGADEEWKLIQDQIQEAQDRTSWIIDMYEWKLRKMELCLQDGHRQACFDNKELYNKLSQLQQQHQQLQAISDQDSGIIDTLETENRDLRRQIEQLQERQVGLEAELGEKETEMAGLQEGQTRLEAELGEKETEMAKLRTLRQIPNFGHGEDQRRNKIFMDQKLYQTLQNQNLRLQNLQERRQDRERRKHRLSQNAKSYELQLQLRENEAQQQEDYVVALEAEEANLGSLLDDSNTSPTETYIDIDGDTIIGDNELEESLPPTKYTSRRLLGYTKDQLRLEVYGGYDKRGRFYRRRTGKITSGASTITHEEIDYVEEFANKTSEQIECLLRPVANRDENRN